MMTCPMLLTLALEEAKKKASLTSRFLRGVSAGEAAPRHLRNDSVWRSSSLPHPRDRLEDGVSPEIIKDYKESDVFNCDETGVFFLQSSNRSLTMPVDDAPRRKAGRTAPHPPANGFLDGREGETSDDLEE